MLSNLLKRLSFDLALDLGTANTRLAIAGEGIVLDEPSIVAVEQTSGRVLGRGAAVGQLAKQLEGRTPQSIRVVRPVCGGAVADFDLCEAMLRRLIRKAKPPGFRLRPRVVVGLPGGATAVERRALVNTLHRAGAGRVWLVRQSQAAALGAGLPLAEPVASLVCDIGAGTTEVAAMSLGETVAAQSLRCGGDAMDQAIADWVRRQHGLRIGPPAAERLRLEAGSAMPLVPEPTAELSGVDVSTGLPRKIALGGGELREALAEPLLRVVEAVKTTIDGCRGELAADLVDRGIVLCGGGALLPGLDRLLAEHTRLPVRLAAEPLTATIRGLLICLERRDHWQPLLQSGDAEP